MNDILKRINKIPGVRGTMIIGEDGLLVASDLSGDEDPNALAAVASSVGSTVASATTRMETGEFSRCLLKGSKGSVVLLSVREAILLTLIRKDANMGMVLVELKDASQELAGLLGT